MVYDEKTYDVFKQTFSAYNQNVGDGKGAGDGRDTGARPKTLQMLSIDDDSLEPFPLFKALSMPLFPMFEVQNHQRENQRNIQTAKDKTNNQRGRRAVNVLRRQRSNSLDGKDPREGIDFILKALILHHFLK